MLTRHQPGLQYEKVFSVGDTNLRVFLDKLLAMRLPRLKIMKEYKPNM